MPDPIAAPVAARPAAADADEALLRDALGDDVGAGAAIARISREPLGAGSVTGFSIDVGGGADAVVGYVDTSAQPVRAETGLALVAADGAVSARVWLHPADPHLPGLAPAAFGHAASGLLARIGIEATGTPAIAAYRPGRRAVLRVPTAGSAAWIKVVRPGRVARIVDLHGLLRAHGLPVPAVRAWSPEGLVILDDAAGIVATEADASADLLLDEVDALRAGLASAPFEAAARTGLAERIDWYAARIGTVAAGALAARIHRALESEVPRPRVGIHGDLHLGQLFVRDARSPDVVGLIDADTAGLGDPAEDAAAFIAHALASTLLSRGMPGEPRLRRISERAIARWGDDPAVRARTAIQLLGHAVGAADRGDEERRDILFDLAESFASGDPIAVPKSPLTPGFETP